MILGRLERDCLDVELLPVSLRWVQEAEKMLAADEGQGIDGYAAYILGIPSNASRAIAMSGRTTVLIDDLYGVTGAFLGQYPAARKAAMPVTGVSSTPIEDICETINTIAIIRKLKASKILVVTPGEMHKRIDGCPHKVGSEIVNLSADKLNAA